MNIDYSNAIANPENVIQGTNYRFTVLTPRLIRMLKFQLHILD